MIKKKAIATFLYFENVALRMSQIFFAIVFLIVVLGLCEFLLAHGLNHTAAHFAFLNLG